MRILDFIGGAFVGAFIAARVLLSERWRPRLCRGRIDVPPGWQVELVSPWIKFKRKHSPGTEQNKDKLA